MAISPDASPPTLSRQQRVEAILQRLCPPIEQTIRPLVQHALDVPEAQEFGAFDFPFRYAGQKMVNQIRQASVASYGTGSGRNPTVPPREVTHVKDVHP